MNISIYLYFEEYNHFVSYMVSTAVLDCHPQYTQHLRVRVTRSCHALCTCQSDADDCHSPNSTPSHTGTKHATCTLWLRYIALLCTYLESLFLERGLLPGLLGIQQQSIPFC